MTCCQCQGLEEEFDARVARRQLRRFRRRGPKRTTQWMIQAIADRNPAGLTLLDIGGGVGEIQHELAAIGTTYITNVDASSAYQGQARDEAARRGYSSKARYIYGDFVEVATGIEPADIVTLDRVICCYHDVDSLVTASSSRARKLYGVVYPRTTWWTRAGFQMINLVQKIRRAAFRAFLHPSSRVEELLAKEGFGRVYHRTSLIWQVSVYQRDAQLQ